MQISFEGSNNLLLELRRQYPKMAEWWRKLIYYICSNNKKKKQISLVYLPFSPCLILMPWMTILASCVVIMIGHSCPQMISHITESQKYCTRSNITGPNLITQECWHQESILTTQDLQFSSKAEYLQNIQHLDIPDRTELLVKFKAKDSTLYIPTNLSLVGSKTFLKSTCRYAHFFYCNNVCVHCPKQQCTYP